MAWELATFSTDLLREPEAIKGVDVEIVPPGSSVRVTHVLDAVEPRIRPDGRAAFPREGRGGEGRTNRLDASSSSRASTFPARSGPSTNRSRSSISAGRLPSSHRSPT
jgi:hypothetical protein